VRESDDLNVCGVDICVLYVFSGRSNYVEIAGRGESGRVRKSREESGRVRRVWGGPEK
jgi:hypothetical protein